MTKVVADPQFLEALGPLAQAAEKDGSVVYGVSMDLKLAYLGTNWFAFAAANGGQSLLDTWQIGRSVTDAWRAPLDVYYRGLFDQALSSGVPVSSDYLCPSATTFREFRMTIHPLRNRMGALVTNSLLVEQPHTLHASPLGHSNYLNPNDSVYRQCMHCRRMMLVSDTPRWDWVPSLVEKMPRNVSHTLCPICLDYYYPP